MSVTGMNNPAHTAGPNFGFYSAVGVRATGSSDCAGSYSGRDRERRTCLPGMCRTNPPTSKAVSQVSAVYSFVTRSNRIVRERTEPFISSTEQDAVQMPMRSILLALALIRLVAHYRRSSADHHPQMDIASRSSRDLNIEFAKDG
jgi:hypothetical protein